MTKLQTIDSPLFQQAVVAPRRVQQILRGLLRLLLVWQQRTHDRALLRDLSAATQADLGLSYDQIQAEVRKPFWRA